MNSRADAYAVLLLHVGCGAAPGPVADQESVVAGDNAGLTAPSEMPNGTSQEEAGGSTEVARGDQAREIACRVALRMPEWGGATGPLADFSMAIRTTRAVGSRDEVLQLAREAACSDLEPVSSGDRDSSSRPARPEPVEGAPSFPVRDVLVRGPSPTGEDEFVSVLSREHWRRLDEGRLLVRSDTPTP